MMVFDLLFESGRGRIVIRGKVRFEETNSRDQIIVEEILYMVNKSNMISDCGFN